MHYLGRMVPIFKRNFLVYFFLLLTGWLQISARAASPDSVLIGNFLRSAPCGIAWVINDSAAFVLDTGGPYVAGTAAPDDSYHRYQFSHNGANIVFEWGRIGDNVVGRLSSDKEVDLNLTLSSGWPGWKSTFTTAPDGATGVAQATKRRGRCGSFKLLRCKAHFSIGSLDGRHHSRRAQFILPPGWMPYLILERLMTA